jgi:magnesium-transporting ATPase (P-type)
LVGERVQGSDCFSILDVSLPAFPCPSSLSLSSGRRLWTSKTLVGQQKANDHQNSIIAVIFSFICVLLLATFPGWHEETDSDGSDREVKPFPSRPVSQIALAIIFIASIFVLVSVLWQHTASVAASVIAEDFGNGAVKSGVGTSAMVMGWFSFTLLIIVTIGLLVMILSIQVLTEMAR